ncbi:phytoene/squalene synthase family protein [bacterium]|nr:phytoene/squalene synthase family protein [bacterium]
MQHVWKDPTYRASFELARLTTAEWSKSFYLASSLLPKEKRWATYALYAYCRLVDNIVDQPRPARSRLEIVRELDSIVHELHVAYRTGESEHPVLRAFIQVAFEYSIPLEHALDLIRGVKMDLELDRYESFEQLYLFSYRVASVVGLMMTHVLGYSHPVALRYAEELGIAMQLTNIMRDVEEDADANRIYLPREDLDNYGVREEDILDGQMTDNLRDLMAFQVNRAHCYYESADRGIALLDPSSRFAIRAASRIYRGILTQIEEQDFNPFRGRVFLPKKKKLSLIALEYLSQLIRAEETKDLPGLIRSAATMQRPQKRIRGREAALGLPTVEAYQE